MIDEKEGLKIDKNATWVSKRYVNLQLHYQASSLKKGHVMVLKRIFYAAQSVEIDL